MDKPQLKLRPLICISAYSLIDVSRTRLGMTIVSSEMVYMLEKWSGMKPFSVVTVLGKCSYMY